MFYMSILNRQATLWKNKPYFYAFSNLMFLISLTILLGSCNFEMSGNVNIKEDGSGEIVSSIAFPKHDYQILPSNQKHNFCDQFNKQGKLGKVELVSRGEKVLCLFKKPFANIKKLKEDGFVVMAQKDGTVELSIDPTTIAKAMGLESDKNLQQASQRNNQGHFTWQQHNKDMASLMRMSMLADKVLNITVKAPHIVETNGIVSEDRKSTEYAVPLMEIIGGNTKLVSTLSGQVNRASNIIFSPDSKKIIVINRVLPVGVWDVVSGQKIMTLGSWSVGIISMVYSPDGLYVASGTQDGTIKVWNSETGKLIKIVKGHSREVYTIDFSPDGHYIVSGSRDKTINIWSTKTGEIIKTLKGSTHAKYSLDGMYIISKSYEGSFQSTTIWDTNRYKKVRTIKVSIHDAITDLSPNGKMYILGKVKDGIFQMYDVITGKVLWKLDRKILGRASVSYSPDGKRIAITNLEIDEKIKFYGYITRLWDASTGKLLKTLKTIQGRSFPRLPSIEFSRDGKILVVYTQESFPKPIFLQFFDVVTGKHLMNKKSVRIFADENLFSPSGILIVTAEGGKDLSSNSRYKIWEILKPRLFKARFYCSKSIWGSKRC